MFTLIVSLQVKPDKHDQFRAAAQDDSTCSVRDEPGCLRFDVLQDNADPNHFFFYEVYQDEDAVTAHSDVVRITRAGGLPPPKSWKSRPMWPRHHALPRGLQVK